MIHTCVIRESQSLTFCLSISIRSHDARMIYAYFITHVRSMGTSNFNLLFRLLCVRIIDFDFSSIITINVFDGLVLY